MKAIQNILMFGVACLSFAACESDMDEMKIGNPSTFVCPVMQNVGNVIVNADNSNSENVIFSWSKADFGLPVQVQYNVYLTYNGAKALLGSTTETMLSVKKGDLNGVLMNDLGVDANQQVDIQALVEAKVDGEVDYEALVSNPTAAFKVSTYQAALKNYYCCGNFTGSWDIANAPIIWETAGGSNTYSAMMDFNDDGGGLSYFKITQLQSWSGDNWGFNDLTPGWGNLDPDQGDSNLSIDISETHIWKITVKTTVMTIDAEKVGNTISLIGGYNDWNGDDLFTYDYKTNSFVTEPIDFASDTEVKARLDKAWSTSWGSSGKMSSAIPGGYELTTDNGANIACPAGKHVIRIYANRTPYVLVIE